MKNPYALILLVAATTAYGQINNPPTSVNIVDSTATGRAVLTATNAAAAATAIGLGTANTASFDSLIIGAGSGDPLNVDFYRIESSSFNFLFDWEEKRLAQGGNNIFSWTSTNASFAVPVTFATNVTVNGNATLNGVDNLAPSQTASSGSSLMTRDLSDDRYSFSRWYDANNLLSGAQAVGVNPLSTGNGSGHVANAILVTVSNVNTKFMLPVDYRVSGEVKVVSYWTDRGLTNGGTTGDIAVWAFPFVVQPTTDTTTNGFVDGTIIKNTFTANYGGSGNSRFYVMEQTLNFATVTGISATNPMQLKWVEFQRRSGDASDTSNDNIFLSGVHIYVP
jgi:hypothetical protein